jgi:hypothetical protein
MKTSDLSKGEQRMLQMIAGAMQLCAPEDCDKEFQDAGLEAFLRGILMRIQNARNALKTAIVTLEGVKQ